MDYMPKIGLEIHVELKTKSKMFCSCVNDSQETEPNKNICPICLGHPGILPTINIEAVKLVIKTGLALNCKIANTSKFERKNYFYPDLPKGYQISQYADPLCKEGFLIIPSNNKKIRIRRIHLEEDTAKLIHPEGENYSLLDFNRAGIPLMELVTEPDIESAKEAKEFARELQLILRYLGVSDADMEKGQMRVEANISLVKNEKLEIKNSNLEKQNLGTKVEIKNLNSFKAVERAIEYEIRRQSKILEDGGEVIQETRGWDEKKGITFSQREKEEAHDYRYFPEPDLPPMEFNEDFISDLKNQLPELPLQKRERFQQEYGLLPTNIEILISNKDLSEYFEKTISELIAWVKEKNISKENYQKLVQITSNYLLSEALGLLGGKPFSEKEFPITPENFAEFITIIYEKNLSSKIAKILLKEMFETKKDPSDILEEKELTQIQDQETLRNIIATVVANNQKAIEDFKKGKESALQFLMGQVMKETKGRADPETTKKLLLDFLNNDKI